MKNKLISIILALSVCVTSIAGCSSNGYPVNIGGVTITKTPEKVVALSESAATVMTALGYDSYIVGAPNEYKENFNKDMTVAGTSSTPDINKIVELSPSLVISSEALSDDYLETFKLHNIDCVVLPAPEVYTSLKAYYTDIAKIFAGEEKGTEAANTYFTELEKSFGDISEGNKTKISNCLIYVEEGFVATGDTLAGQIIEKAGIKNIAKDKTAYSMSLDDIISSNPDMIFCPKGLSNTIISNSALKDVTAIKNGAVYEVGVSEIVYAGASLSSVLGDMSNYLK